MAIGESSTYDVTTVGLPSVSIESADCSLFNFVIWGCVVLGLTAFGYVGNLLSLFALQRDCRTPATTLLQCLAISDLVLLLSVCVTDAIPYVCDYTRGCSNPWTVWPYIRFVWFLTPIAHMCSIWLVVLVAANRYWAVCRPHAVADVWTNPRTWRYVAAVVLLSLTFNSPRFLEYRIVEVPGFDANSTARSTESLPGHGASLSSSATVISGENWVAGNGSVVQFAISYPSSIHAIEGAPSMTYSVVNEIPPYEHLNGSTNDPHQLNPLPLDPQSIQTLKLQEIKTSFGKHNYYRVGYKVILVNALLVLAPLTVLLISSIWIIRSLRLSARLRKRPSTISNGLQEQEHKTRTGGKRTTPSREVTFLLVTVVLVSVACQTPLAVFHFVRYLFTYTCGDVVFYLETGSKLLVNLNSCVNFVIYCLLSPKFRRLLHLTVTCQSQTIDDRRVSYNQSMKRMAGAESFRKSEMCRIPNGDKE